MFGLVDDEEILSEVHVAGGLHTGFRLAAIPLNYKKEPNRLLCRGQYEVRLFYVFRVGGRQRWADFSGLQLWWVQRTRWNFQIGTFTVVPASRGMFHMFAHIVSRIGCPYGAEFKVIHHSVVVFVVCVYACVAVCGCVCVWLWLCGCVCGCVCGCGCVCVAVAVCVRGCVCAHDLRSCVILCVRV